MTSKSFFWVCAAALLMVAAGLDTERRRQIDRPAEDQMPARLEPRAIPAGFYQLRKQSGLGCENPDVVRAYYQGNIDRSSQAAFDAALDQGKCWPILRGVPFQRIAATDGGGMGLFRREIYFPGGPPAFDIVVFIPIAEMEDHLGNPATSEFTRSTR